MVDTSDTLGNQGLVISFLHVPSGKSVYFKAFITAFTETYTSDWDKEQLFGRADPVFTFKSTTRKISLSFKIPSATHGEGYENLAKVQNLTQFLYPTYTDVQNALTITQSPLMRLKVMNLAVDQNAKGYGSTFKQLAGGDPSGTTAKNGLLGVLHSLDINHNLSNYDTSAYEMGTNHSGTKAVIPRMIEVATSFTVIHEHHLGWAIGEGGEGFFRNPAFPYGLDPHGTNRRNARAVAEDRISALRSQADLLRDNPGIGAVMRGADRLADEADAEADALQRIVDDNLVPDEDLLDSLEAFAPFPEEAYGAPADTAADANAQAEEYTVVRTSSSQRYVNGVLVSSTESAD
jgi:hypothetical protein